MSAGDLGAQRRGFVVLGLWVFMMKTLDFLRYLSFWGRTSSEFCRVAMAP